MERQVAKLPDGELIIDMMPQDDYLFLLSNKGNAYVFSAVSWQLNKIVESDNLE